MVSNKEFESAIRGIAVSLNRTYGEWIKYRRPHPPHKGEIDWRPRAGTVLADNSAGNNIWHVFIANTRGNKGSLIIRGTKRQIVDFAYRLAEAKQLMAKPRMKKLRGSKTGSLYG